MPAAGKWPARMSVPRTEHDELNKFVREIAQENAVQEMNLITVKRHPTHRQRRLSTHCEVYKPRCVLQALKL